MTKPAPPTEELVEMEAMDLEEWEQDQHTPQAPDAKLAALVKQSAEETPPTGVRHQQSNSVARTVTKQPPPPPGPLKPGDMNPFDGPTMANAGAGILPTRADPPTTKRSTATPAAGTSTNRHTTTRSATPAATPRLQPSRTATPAGPLPRLQPTAASQAATPAGGSPTAASQAAAALHELSTPSKGTSPATGRTHTQAIGRIERTPANPPASPPSTRTPVGGVPAVTKSAATPVGDVPTKSAATPVRGLPARSATPVGGVPAAGMTSRAKPVGGTPATPAVGTPVVSAKMTQAIGALERAPAPATSPAGTAAVRPEATPAGGLPTVGAKLTQAIGRIERPPAASVRPAVAPPESEGWSLPDDFDEVAAQEWKAAPPAAVAPESTASRALAMPTPAASPKSPAPGASPTAASPPPPATSPPPVASPPPPATSPSLAAAAPLSPPAASPMPSPPAASPPIAASPSAASPSTSPSTEVPPDSPLSVNSKLFVEATAAGGVGFAPEPAAAPPQRTPLPAPTGPQPYVAQSSVQPHSQPVHVFQGPQAVFSPPPSAAAPMARAPMPSAPVPSAPMFEETRADRHETTDSHRVVGKKPWLLIGGGIGAVALLLVIVMLMRSKDEPKVADKPSKPTPDLVDPVVTPPPDEVVAVVTPDAAEPPPDAGVPPRIGKNPIVATSPENRTPKNPGTPKNPKNPRIRGTTTSAIETGSTPDPVTGGGGDPEKSAKAQAAYKTGNQKLYAGDANGAIIAYRQVIAMGSASGYRGLGLSYAQQGDTANAIAAFKKYLQMSPKAADAAVIKRRLTALQGK